MEYNEAIEKVQKLMRLAQSANEHEAALAAQRAQEIMTRFNIEAAALQTEAPTPQEDEAVEDFRTDPLLTGANARASFRTRLASHIARQNQVKVYLCANSICLIGRPSDVQTVRYMFAMLHAEVLRLCNLKCKGHSGAYKNSWRRGCVATIGARLANAQQDAFKAARTETANNPLALVRVNRAIDVIDRRQRAVEEFMDKMNMRKSRTAPQPSHSDAYWRGRQDGAEARITRATGALGSAAAQIGGAQ